MRMSRWAGLLSGDRLKFLKELFADMTVIKTGASRCSSTEATIATDGPSDEPWYVLYFNSNGLTLAKVDGLNLTKYIGNATLTAAEYNASTTRVTAAKQEVHAIISAQFPSFTNEQITSALAAVRCDTIVASASTTAGVIGTALTNITTKGLYLASLFNSNGAGRTGRWMSISAGDDLFTPLFSWTTRSETVYENQVYLYEYDENTLRLSKMVDTSSGWYSLNGFGLFRLY